MRTDAAVAKPLLIFDLDGTLYRTESSFVRTMRVVFAAHRLSYPGDGAILGMVGETFETFLAWLGERGFASGDGALREEIARIEMDEIRTHGELYDGVPETLKALAEDGCALVLCTNGDRRYVDAVLRRGGIAGRFERLSTLEPGGRTKAERVGDLAIGFPGRAAMVVGDRYHDLEAARANGCRMIGAAYGYARDGELDGADIQIRRFSDLPAAVRRLV